MFGGSKPHVERIKSRYEKIFELDCRVEFTLYILNLQAAGYPLKGNQLRDYQWFWINEMRNVIHEIKTDE